jgi:uncharacterized protein YggE
MNEQHESRRSNVGVYSSRSVVRKRPGGFCAERDASSRRSVTSTLARRFAPAVAAAIAFATVSTALADDGIVVRGSGSASGRPTQVEMSGTINADAELAADAIVKFRDAKKRALAAIEGLKNPDLTVVPGGLSVGSGMDANQQMMAMRGMAAPATGQKVRLSETMRIVLAHTDKLGADELMDKLLKILDVAKDAGFQIGSAQATNYYEAMIRAQEGDTGNSATVSFRLPDPAPLRDKAYQAAIDDAKAKAQKLAELAGGKLGRVIAVHEEAVAKSDSEPSQMMMLIYGMMSSSKGGAEDKALSGATSGNLTLRVNLTVQFEIAK